MEKSTTAGAKTLTKELLVQNKMGIHARPAAMIVRVTQPGTQFSGDLHCLFRRESSGALEQ